MRKKTTLYLFFGREKRGDALKTENKSKKIMYELLFVNVKLVSTDFKSLKER